MTSHSSCSVQFSSVLWPIGSSGGHEGRFSRDPLPVLSAGGPYEQFLHEQICPLFDVVHPAFPLPTTASPTLQDAPKDGFGEAVVACDMPEPCKFPPLDSCQKRFLWSLREADLAPHAVVGCKSWDSGWCSGVWWHPVQIRYNVRDCVFRLLLVSHSLTCANPCII